MPTIRLQITLVIVCLILLLYLTRGVQKKKIDVKYAMPWILLGVFMLFTVIFPQWVIWLCAMLGFLTASNLVFFFAVIFLFIIVFLMSRTISRLNNEVKELTQRMSLEEFERYKEKMEPVEEKKEDI